MNKFNVGDKVESPLGLGIVVKEGMAFGSYIIYLGKPYIKCDYKNELVFNARELKLHKTAHEKLLDLGWNFGEYLKYKQYEKFDENSRRTMSIRIFNDENGIYYFLNNFTYVEKELSKILTQYLEELENDNT